LVEFEADNLKEAKEAMWANYHPQDLDGVEINELNYDLDIDYDLVEEVSSEEI
jgi:hypothetical protein